MLLKPGRCFSAVGACVPSGICLLAAAAMLAAGCASQRGRVPPVDAEIRSLAGSAGAAYERGETGRAAELYGRALARARQMDDPGESARNAYNLALCRMAEGRIDEARGLLAQARALLPPKGADAARTWVAEAEAAQRQGLLEDVRRLVQCSLEAGPDGAARAQAHLILVGLECVEGDWPAARKGLDAARRELRRLDAPELQARAEGLAARLARAAGDGAGAGAALERQAEWLKQAGRFPNMAAALAAAGEAYRAAGLSRQAYPCLMRAAASLKGQGNAKAATPAAMAALSIAQALNEAEWAAAATALTAELMTP